MKKSLYAIAFSLLLLIGCRKENIDGLNKSVLSTDSKALSERLSFKNIGVLGYDKANKTGGRLTQPVPEANQYPIELIAELNPPSYNGVLMRASHVHINGTLAYVSYNREGEAYLGGIEIIDVSNALQPAVVAQLLFPDRDVTAVYYHNNRVYFAGALLMPNYPGYTTPAFFGWIDLASNGAAFTQSSAMYNMPGRTATDLQVDNNKLYVTSGSDGVFQIFDLNTNNVTFTETLSDLRSVSIGNSLVGVYAGNGALRYYNKATNSLVRTITMPPDILNAKRSGAFYNDYLLLGTGKTGLQMYDPAGSKVDEILLPATLPGIDPFEIVTNGVSNNNGMIVSANGAAGLYVSDVTSLNTLNVVGRVDLNGSANYVQSSGNHIYVANGRGGFKIIQLVRGTIHGINCQSFPTYTGNANLVVPSGSSQLYGQAMALQSLTVAGNLYHCGTATVLNSLEVENGGVLEMHGAISQGTYPSSVNPLVIKTGGRLKVEGHLKIYGNLIMQSGSTLEFLGTNSRLTLYGTYTRGTNVRITGTSFIDTYTKLDVTPDYNTVFSYLNTANQSGESVSTTAVALDAFQRFEFNALSNPQGSSNTMFIYEGSNLKLSVTFPADYLGKPFRYSKTTNQSVVSTFAAGNKFF